MLLGVALTLAIAGGLALWLFARSSRDTLVHHVPSRSIAYAHLFLRPSTHQRVAIRDLLERLSLDVNDGDLKEALGRLLDPVLAVSGMSYEDDVSPWLGDQIGFYLLPGGEEAVLFEVEDGREGMARGAARAATSGREQITAVVVDDVLIVGTRDAVAAASSGPQQSLRTNDRYQKTLALLPEDRTLTLYTVSDQRRGIAAAGVARSDGAVFDLVAPGSQPREIGPGDLSDMIGTLDRTDVLPFGRIGDLLQRLEDGGPAVIAAMRATGILRDGGADLDKTLGDGFSSSLVLDVGRISTLVADPAPVFLRESGRYISHIVLGTHPEGTIRIFIGVK